jgi:hypothetical protein
LSLSFPLPPPFSGAMFSMWSLLQQLCSPKTPKDVSGFFPWENRSISVSTMTCTHLYLFVSCSTATHFYYFV